MGGIVKAGLVGCGSVAQRGILPHLSQQDARERVRLVAVVDTVEERARETAARFDVPAHFTGMEAMLASADVDLVLIASPIPHHFAQAMAAITAGKHVYVQKTMTSTLAEAEALLAVRDRAGVRLAAAPGFDLCTTTVHMRRAVEAGDLGHVYTAYTYTLGFGHEHEPIRGGRGALAAIDPSWYYRRGAGPLPDVTVYALQLATSVLGPVRRVTALSNRGAAERGWQGNRMAVEVDDNNLLTLEFASGALAVAVGANCWGSERIPWGGLGLYGDGGRLEVTEVEMTSGYPVAFELQSGRADASPLAYRTSLAEQPHLQGAHLEIEEPHIYVDIMDLVESIRVDRPPRASGEQARHVVEIIERAQAAARTGQTQQLVSSFSPVDGEA
jgi:predicted dehydrogenase